MRWNGKKTSGANKIISLLWETTTLNEGWYPCTTTFPLLDTQELGAPFPSYSAGQAKSTKNFEGFFFASEIVRNASENNLSHLWMNLNVNWAEKKSFI